MTVKHAIAEPWRAHLQQVQQALRDGTNQIWILRGQIADIEAQQKSRHEHASLIVGLIRKEADLPETVNHLSDDGCFLVGEMEPAKYDPPSPLPSAQPAPDKPTPPAPLEGAVVLDSELKE